MREIHTHSSAQPLPYIEVGGEGTLIHFSHANGFPPLSYRALLEPFTESHQVIASVHRPLWQPNPDPSSLHSWEVFGEDLLQVAAGFKAPMIAIGHSMGCAAILIAMAKRPELFKSIVLIEPVLLPRRFLFALRFFSKFASSAIPLLRKTLSRVDRWSSQQEAFEHFRPKFVFKQISDEVLWDYIQHGTRASDDGNVELSYSKEWEARCYTQVYNLWSLLPHITVPLLAVRGQESDTIFPAAWDKWQSISSNVDFIEIEEAGHLVPFEKPEQLSSTILKWIEPS